MAGARLWYYPMGTFGAYREIDLGRPLGSRLLPQFVMDQEIQESMGGHLHTQHIKGSLRITVVFQWDISRTDLDAPLAVVRRELVGMINHLQRGGSIALAEDYDYAYATFATFTPGEGDLGLLVQGDNIMPDAGPGIGSVGLTDREMYLSTDSQSSLIEMFLCRVDGHPRGFITADTPRAWNYPSDSYALVREAGSYPALRLVPGQRNSDMLRSDDDRVFELRLELEEDPTELSRLWSQHLSGAGGETGGPTWQPQIPGAPPGPGPIAGSIPSPFGLSEGFGLP